MWHYNGEDDASRCGRKGPDTPAALAKILVELFKGEEEEFLRIKRRDGFSMYSPPSWVSPNSSALLTPLPELLSMNINPSIYNSTVERFPKGFTAPPRSPRATIRTLTPDSKSIRIYSWCSRTGCFTRRAMTAPKWPSPPIIPVFSLLHT